MKPVRNRVSRSCAGPSTTPSSTVSSSPVEFGSDDHEMRIETRAVKPGSANQRESFIERDRVTNSQERHEDTRSRATTGSPLTREPSQTAENPSTYTGRLVPTVKSWDAGSGLETKEECDILSDRTIVSDSNYAEPVMEKMPEKG